jgi:cytochrome c556
LTISALAAYRSLRALIFVEGNGKQMGTIVPFLRGQSVFDPEAVQAMSAALNQACDALKLPETAARERETVAVRIIELARRGERDAGRLCERVLHEAGGR